MAPADGRGKRRTGSDAHLTALIPDKLREFVRPSEVALRFVARDIT